jgi:hypothetical protein
VVHAQKELTGLGGAIKFAAMKQWAMLLSVLGVVVIG